MQSCKHSNPLKPPPMENRRKKSTSGDTFSFPSTPIHDQDSDFEFGCFTPDSAASSKDSPADHLFFNGRLLPHAFPFQQPIISNGFMVVDNSSRFTSRTSSISSKDSLMSSRSNSTNSRSSSCSSSARTSSSDISERKFKANKASINNTINNNYKNIIGGHQNQVYGSSQRWQFITAVPVPASLSRDNSRKKVTKVEAAEGKGREKKSVKGKKKGRVKKTVVARRRFGWRFFRWLVSTCKKCHAMEPSKKSSVDHVIKAEN